VYRTRIKICGITREADGLAAARLGVDAIGLVFYPDSPRAVSAEQAARIVAALPAFVTTVGLFVDATETAVRDILARVPLDELQFHGSESPEYCAGFGRSWVKALRMRDDIDLHDEARRYAHARALLLDAWVADRAGGTGETFDWDRIPEALQRPVILAGGLSPDNVAEAVRRVRPWAVDVSGGVEERDTQGHKKYGCKSVDAMQAFVRGVNGV
jgi:phosphoribosylanthranilate isomerase